MTVKNVILPRLVFERMKQAARKLKKAEKIPHHAALDRVARGTGQFNHWHDVVRAANQTAPVETAFREGLVVAYDVAEALDHHEEGAEGVFVEDYRIRYFCEPDLREAIGEFPEPEEGGRLFKDVWADDLDVIIEEVLDELLFFRYQVDPIPETIEDSLAIAQEHFFWMPSYVWLRGSFLNVDRSETEFVGG